MDLPVEVVHRSFAVVVRSINEAERCVDVVASTAALDSYDEIVDQSWDLKRYRANPVVLYNHNREGFLETLEPEDTLPIGYSRDVGVRNGQLEATLCFVDQKANPMAELVWQGFLQKSLRAVSVGFNPRNVTSEKIDDKTVYRLSDNELFEISVTPMGANPEAVVKARTKSMDQLRRLAAASSTEIQPAAKMATNEEQRTMDIKELEAALATSKAAHAEALKQLEATKAALSTAAEQAKTLATEKDAALVKVTELSTELASAKDKLVELEVEALVGVKIDQTQKSAFVKLAKESRPNFDTVIASMPTKSTLTKVVSADPAQENKVAAEASADAGQDLASAIDKKAATL